MKPSTSRFPESAISSRPSRSKGAPATEKTEVWVFFDDEAIYIAGRCWDTQPHRIVATELRRDHGSIWLNQHLAVTFDTFYDRRNAFIFYLNPLGGFFDGLITDERNFNRDWTAVWDSRTARFEGGWTTETAVSVQDPPLPRRGPTGLGHQLPPGRPLEERNLLPDPAPGRPRDLVDHQGEFLCDPGRPRGAAQLPDHRGEAVPHG